MTSITPRAIKTAAPAGLRTGAVLAAIGLAGCTAARPPARPVAPASDRVATVDEVVRTRCDRDGRDVITTWRGTVYSFVPGERQRALFQVVGMNVARCLHDVKGWFLTSRELMYYLDPDTGRVLERWTNPWTGESVPVVHVANALVQMRLGGGAPLRPAGELATIAIDVPLFYPNALARSEDLAAYSPTPNYQAGEFFGLTAPANQIEDARAASVRDLQIAWFRISPWLPWMNMGDRAGQLVISAHGRKVPSIADLPDTLRDEITLRLPRYARAPACFVDLPNETSWTYFAAHVDAYRAGARFPLPEPPREEPCKAAPR